MLSRTSCWVGTLSVWLGIGLTVAPAAEFKTTNFVVSAPTPEVARKVGEAAERFRKQISVEWLGKELPRWSARCPIRVRVGQIGAGGATTFNFHPVPNRPSEVCDWNMEVQGTLERILDSVIPHEVSHTIFACHFRRPLPRWADEGAATLVEIESERRIQTLTVNETINTRRRIPLRQLLAMKEYPSDQGALRVLYAQGYSLAQLLVQEGGKQRYLAFLEDAHRTNWDQAIARHYPHKNVEGLEQYWQKWVLAGSRELEREPGLLIADGTLEGTGAAGRSDEVVIRGQNEDADDLIETPVRGKTGGRDAAREVAGRGEVAAPVPRRRAQGPSLGQEDSADREENDPYLTLSRSRTEAPAGSTRPASATRKNRELAASSPRAKPPSRPLADLEGPPSRAEREQEEDDPLGAEEFPSVVPAGRARVRQGGVADRDAEPAPRRSPETASPPVPRRRPQYSESPAEFESQLTLMPRESRQ
ncbi:MAG: hypothetical protein ACK5EA_25640 [Planctomycetaceae bacterium]|jgi:hypothetical protein